MSTTSTDRRFGVSSSLGMKAPVLVASTGNLTLSGLQTVDGISLAEGDRVLVKDQSDATTNGIYVAHSTAWTRDADFDGARDIVKGTAVSVTDGTANAATLWKVATANPVTIGTSALVFTPFAVPAFLTDVATVAAVGDGVTDCTAAFQAALATGATIYVPPGTYKITGALSITANGQRLVGAGPYLATLVCSGNFDIITASGGNQGGGVESLAIDATSMTGGNAIVVNAYHRSLFRDLLIFNPWNAFSITHQNVTAIQDVWCNNIRGSYGISWAGNDSNRGDLLRLTNVTLGCNSTARPTGLIVDGYQNTVEAVSLDIVTPGVGIDIRNTLGGTNVPLFFHGWNCEVDFPSGPALKISAGSEHHFTDSYFQGSTGDDGVFIGSAASIISLKGCQITGHNKNGVNVAGQHVALSACHINGNSQAGAGTYDGVTLASTVQGFTMVGGSCGGSTQRYGVNAQSGAVRIAIAGVDLIGNLTKAFVDNTGGGNDNFSLASCAGSLTSIIDGVKITTDSVPPLVQAYTAAATNATLTLSGQGTGGVDLGQSGDRIGFFGTTPVEKQTVSGSKGANAALTSLIAALVAHGLITDTTT
jgi:hypothetical protein